MTSTSSLIQQPLSAGWRARRMHPGYTTDPAMDQTPNPGSDGADWFPAMVPGTVHQDLLAAGRIPDPFFGTNETDLQWIGTSDWIYQCTFDVPDAVLRSDRVMLCFDGLDTFATVWLNGERVLTTENMFVPERVSVKSLLRAAGNVLEVWFESAFLRGKQLEHEYGARPAWNGDASRLYVRKAQYHYGWDWGPTFLTAGIWRPVYLEAFTACIADVHAPSEVSADLRSATVPVSLIADGPAALARITLISPKGQAIADKLVPVEGGTAAAQFEVTDPTLWYPLGYGDQPRYEVRAALYAADAAGPDGKLSPEARPLDEKRQRIGLRRLRLVQEPLSDEPGRTFYFEVNNIPIFCGGANWIPADSFVPRITGKRYQEWIRLAAEAHMNMLRVWGGGIYEEDAFYDACDEAGILVWQDFMFACGMYPAHARFQALVRAEAEANVRRLRHHPSIALWCGNNEDYQVAQSLNAYDPAVQRDFRFPARAIYEGVLPDVCRTLDPTRPYWPGSPYGGKDVFDTTIGDRHSWEVWHGPKADYRAYPTYSGRFVSEFGMQGAPALQTISAFAAPPDRYPESRVMEHHNKAGEGPQRLSWYVSANVRLPATLEEYIYATQFIQAEAVGFAFDCWRRRWNGPGAYRTAGALVWQLNDCWPVTSWALADYALRPKAAYYRARRGLRQVTLAIARGPRGHDLWAVNMLVRPVEVILDIRILSLSGALMQQTSRALTLTANRAVDLDTIADTGGGPNLIHARLLKNQEEIASAVAWPEPVKHYIYPDPEISVQRIGHDTIRIQALRPARGVLITAESGATLSDNFLDLMPGEPQVISGDGIGDSALSVWSVAGKAGL